MPARPVCSKQGQGVGIPAARQADGDRGRGLMLQTLVQDGANAGLKIGDIDWRAGTVTLKGTKTLRQDILPLPLETGLALADYLQHERPLSTSPSLFVMHRGDHDRGMTADDARGVIKWAYRRIGLKHTRSHALRHAFACRLVERGSSLKEVADLLRHRSLNSTLIYAKLDTPKLAAVALPWPGSAA